MVLLAPSGAPLPFYAEFGWVAAAGNTMPLPNSDTVWKQQGNGTLGVDRPVTLVHDNGQGLEFRRTISVDDKYMFTVRDEVVNKGAEPATLYPYALISRHGHPKLEGFYILHEGLIGVFGEQGLKEVGYADIEKQKQIPFKATNAWLGITDKYWAATLVPDTSAAIQAVFSAGLAGTTKTYQTHYLLDSVTIEPGATGTANARLFAGAKEVETVDGYERQYKLNRFELLIDWGYFHFITKPLFLAMDWIYRYFGNFGVAILLITVIIKIFFFPLANKSYASMAKMKAVQPEMLAIRERYGDDKVKQQQAMMELYKKEKINPIAGCLPILIQIPVFFALYKVLFITIEMRHAPFFGWIKDLSAPDPTTIFNLFGLIPWDPLTTLGPNHRPVPDDRRLADHHGHHDVVPDEAQPGAAGPDPEDDLRLDAADLHLHAGELLGRAGDLLGLEQPALGHAAELHHAQARRQDRAVGQHQGAVRHEEGRRQEGRCYQIASVTPCAR